MKHSGRGEGPDPPQLHCGCSWLTCTSISHRWVAATTASQLGEGNGICCPEPLWVHLLSLSEPATLASPLPYYPKSSVLQQILEHYGRGYSESLWLGLQLKRLSPQLRTHQPWDGEVKAWHLHIFCLLKNALHNLPYGGSGWEVIPLPSNHLPGFYCQHRVPFFCVVSTWSLLLRWQTCTVFSAFLSFPISRGEVPPLHFGSHMDWYLNDLLTSEKK